MLIRVKERGLNKKNRKNKEREKNDQEREETKRKTKLGEFACLITNLQWR